MLYGYTGKLLFVDLGSRTWEVRELDEKTAKNFVGGPSLGAKILYGEMPAGVDAFSSESVVGFVSGPTNGTGPLMGGRYTVVSKSPVTGGWNDANSGGSFGPKLRMSGYDGVFVKGVSETPVYIYINNGAVEIRDAEAVWGMTVEAAELALKEDIGDSKAGIALIGPAGERMSYMAAVMNDTHRAAGRGGTGAVMGSKKLKAVVCSGNVGIEVFDREKIVALNKETAEYGSGPMSFIIKMMGDGGTASMYKNSVVTGDASTKNWGGDPAEMTEDMLDPLTSQMMDKYYKKKKFACHACSMGCGAIYEINEGKYPIKETGRPEYETLGMFGSQMLNGDAESVNYCNFLANEYGFDTISLGGTIAWMMECYNNGIFTLEETGGIDLKWGNSDAIVKMAETICKADSEMGAVLNKASQGAAEHYGKGFEYLMVADGIEAPQHDARRAPGLARTYKYDPTPGRHVKGGLGFMKTYAQFAGDFDSTGSDDVAGTSKAEITNLLGFCLLGEMGLPAGIEQKYLAAVTGFEYTDDEWLKLGIRSFVIRHLFNVREGILRGQHNISDRLVGNPPMESGPNAGITIDTEKLADNFYGELGWELETSIPTKASLVGIGGFDEIIDSLRLV